MSQAPQPQSSTFAFPSPLLKLTIGGRLAELQGGTVSCLSVFALEGLAIVCANPVFPISEPDAGILVFEVFDQDSTGLRRRLGQIEQYVLDPRKPAFWGRVTRIEPCQSTHPGLSLLRHKPTLRVEITVHNVDQSTKN